MISPWFGKLETEEAFFPLISRRKGGLLCQWAPSEELFAFPRRKAWFCCEPQVMFRSIEGGTWPAIRARLASHEFLCHNHPDPRWRVPHITHRAPLAGNHRAARYDKAVAGVSIHAALQGGTVTKLSQPLRDAPLVDLYGRAG